MKDRTRPGKFVGLWSAGPGYSLGEWPLDAEIFDTVEHAREVLRQRYTDGATHPGTTPHVAEWVEQPGLGAGLFAIKGNKGFDRGYGLSTEPEILLAPRTSTALEDLERSVGDACTVRVFIGPQGGIRVEKI